MSRNYSFFVLSLLLVSGMNVVWAEPIVLETSKDTFGRSNNRTRNNGASEHLMIAHNPSVKTLISFDLSSVTNVIEAAEFTFRIHNTMQNNINVILAPMVQTPNNVNWGEGAGALGARGQIARVGEATYQWSYFRDVLWESAPDTAVVNLADAKLWEHSVATLDNVSWTEGEWVTLTIKDVGFLEEIRLSDLQTFTIGVWGTSGSGLYNINSKESGYAAQLNLEVHEEPKEE